jgi:predicted metal-dependent phosphoesterase TrpH
MKNVNDFGLADLHLHTLYSYDGTASVPAVLERAKEAGLNVIAITDHDEIRGALIAQELAPRYGLEVIPGIEITTAEGDLLALGITKRIERGLLLAKTVLEAGKQGGFCIAPHPTAEGLGMKSLSWATISAALRNPDIAQTLIGIETYNATLLDREGNHYADVLANRYHISKVGNSDAHVLEAIGLGMTEFPGSTADDLLAALKNGTTTVRKGREWNTFQILGSWFAKYAASAVNRFSMAAQ